MTMLQHMRRLACVAAVGIAALAWASPARAQMTLTLTDVNTLATTSFTDSGTGDIFSSPNPLVLGNYTITLISASANYDGNTAGNTNTGQGYIENVVLNVSQSGSTGGTNDSLIASVTTAGAASWSVPAGSPLLLTSGLAATRLDGFNGGPTGTFLTFSSTLNSGLASTTVNAPNQYSLVNGLPNSGSATNPTPPFYLNNTFTINTTGVGQIVNADATTTVTAIVPEPSSLAVAGIGALSLIGYGLRRRKALGA